MGWIFVDKDSEERDGMRTRMRESMKRGYRQPMGGGDSYDKGYETGYKHGWEDKEDETDGEYRRGRMR